MLYKLESELLEEPLVITGLVLFLEDLLDGVFSVLTLGGLLESLQREDSLKGIVVEVVTGGHDVAIVDTLDERLDLSAALDLLLSVTAGDLLGVTLDTDYKGVAEGVRFGTLIEGFNNDDLFTGLTTPSDDGDLVWFEEFSHSGVQLKRCLTVLTTGKCMLT